MNEPVAVASPETSLVTTASYQYCVPVESPVAAAARVSGAETIRPNGARPSSVEIEEEEPQRT